MLLDEEQPSAVRVTLGGGAVVVLEQPTLRNDSLASSADPGVGAALADIRGLEVRRLSAARSLGVALIVGAIGASWTAIARGVQGGTTGGPGPLPK